MEFGAAVFAGLGGLDLAAEELSGDLHAVADAEDGDAEVEDSWVAPGGTFFVDGGGTAGKDDADRVECAEGVKGNIGADEDGVDAGFADAAGDELDVLGAEVEDGNGLLCVGKIGSHAADCTGGWIGGKGLGAAGLARHSRNERRRKHEVTKRPRATKKTRRHDGTREKRKFWRVGRN